MNQSPSSCDTQASAHLPRKNPPPLIVALSLLLLILGVWSLTGMLLGSIGFIDLSVLGVIFAYGLLQGNNSSRQWTLFFAFLVLLGAPIMVTVLLIQAMAHDQSFQGLPTPFQLASLILAWLLSGITIWVLKFSRSASWFTADLQSIRRSNTLYWYLLLGLIAIVVPISLLVAEF